MHARTSEAELKVRERDERAQSAHGFNLLFRPSFLDKVSEGNHLSFVAEISRATGLAMPTRREAVAAYLDRAYAHMTAFCPSEYAYKNEITNKLFLARHDAARASLTSEFRISDARADLVVLNGTSTGYEVKTRYDSLDRLPSQLASYLRVLDRVVVVCSACHLDDVLRATQPEVGVIAFGDDTALATVREPVSNADDVDPGAIFDCLRRSEYVAAVEERFGVQPETANTEIYSKFRRLFVALPPRAAHDVFVRALTARFRLGERQDAVDAVPYSLKQTFFDAHARDRRRLFAADLLRRRVRSRRNDESETSVVFPDPSREEV